VRTVLLVALFGVLGLGVGFIWAALPGRDAGPLFICSVTGFAVGYLLSEGLTLALRRRARHK
jgi:hypothetical protein